jgi:hypothetical protein
MNPYHDPHGPARPRRTGLFVGIGAGAVVLVLIVVGGVALVLFGGGSTHEVAPQCSEFEGELLAEHVPDPDLTRDDFTEQSFWDELSCEWMSEAGTSGAPGYASVFLMRNDGNTPDETTRQSLDTEIEGRDTEPVEGVGEEAYSWYDDAGPEGCVATRTDNIFLRVCYDAQEDFLDTTPIESDAAVAGATELATDFVAVIEQRV